MRVILLFDISESAVLGVYGTPSFMNGDLGLLTIIVAAGSLLDPLLSEEGGLFLTALTLIYFSTSLSYALSSSLNLSIISELTSCLN